jgi:membrane protease YdiL (CAAX protease family)
MSKSLKYPVFYLIYLFIVWIAFRASGIVLPQEVDEFLIKPIIWLLPIFLILFIKRESVTSLGITLKNLYPGIYLAMLLGLVFAIEGVVVNYIKYGQINLGTNIGGNPLYYSLFISLITAISEETVFRGFLFNRFLKYFNNEYLAILLTSVFWLLIHIPATFAVLGYSLTDAMVYWLLAFLYSIAACLLFARTKNIFSTYVLFVLWETSIILLR